MKHDDYDWANEYIVLFESKEELIVLHRNMLRNEEFILLTDYFHKDEMAGSKYLLTFAEYEQLIEHELKIRSFQKKQDNFQLFRAFFGQSISDFFNDIRSL